MCRYTNAARNGKTQGKLCCLIRNQRYFSASIFCLLNILFKYKTSQEPIPHLVKDYYVGGAYDDWGAGTNSRLIVPGDITMRISLILRVNFWQNWFSSCSVPVRVSKESFYIHNISCFTRRKILISLHLFSNVVIYDIVMILYDWCLCLCNFGSQYFSLSLSFSLSLPDVCRNVPSKVPPTHFCFVYKFWLFVCFMSFCFSLLIVIACFELNSLTTTSDATLANEILQTLTLSQEHPYVCRKWMLLPAHS